MHLEIVGMTVPKKLDKRLEVVGMTVPKELDGRLSGELYK